MEEIQPVVHSMSNRKPTHDGRSQSLVLLMLAVAIKNSFESRLLLV